MLEISNHNTTCQKKDTPSTLSSIMNTIISHLYKNKENDQWVIQTNDDHSKNVASLCEKFASQFGMPSWGYVLGVLHDKGKESIAFQQHIKRESGFDPVAIVNGNTHHAYVGAILARRLYGDSSTNVFVNQIFSHHSGLHDDDELFGLGSELNSDIPQEIDTTVKKKELERANQRCDRIDFNHLSRMLYSCLVDADFLDTESFMDKESSKLRNNKPELKCLLPKLDSYLEILRNKAKSSTVNDIRNEVQKRCVSSSSSSVGFYSLTVPTGGGKTLSSLVWAIKHAIHNGQKRIIIAIPYTSIIVQTASILRQIFGEECVLEHHSNVDPEEIKDEKLKEKMKLATENWDYPIIVTTNVQLFESMFSNKPSVCRKLHNIVNSVIILDEVQNLPMNYLQPIVNSLKTYNKLFNVSVLFTTASQPILSGLIEGCNPQANFNGIEQVSEIIPNELNLHDKLRRVKISINNDGKTYDEVAKMLSNHSRVLCIVNTRRDAKELFERLPKEGITLHLSKMMCPAHICKTIETIKAALKDENHKIIRVVSTQLIEAGVDIDFPVVFRQEAGLDSILQAAGRCNREGKNGLSTTYVFSLNREHNLHQDIRAANNARLNLGGERDWFAPETMTEYFRQRYYRQQSFDGEGITNLLANCLFKTAANKFKLIEDTGTNVIVCWENSMELTKQLLENGPSYMLMKKLSKYMVNINKSDFKNLKDMGILSEKKEGVFVVDYKQQYDKHIGLRTDNKMINEILIK